MATTITRPDVSAAPSAPRNPQPYRPRPTATRRFDTSLGLMDESGGPVTRNVPQPRWTRLRAGGRCRAEIHFGPESSQKSVTEPPRGGSYL